MRSRSEGQVPERSTAVRLAGQELHEQRHVCWLLRGEEGPAVVTPFQVEGLSLGQRVVIFLDEERRSLVEEALGGAGVDVPEALRSGALEMLGWRQSLLPEPGFDATTAVQFVLRSLAEGRSRGFPLTRLVQSMAWVLLDPEYSAAVSAYETALENALHGSLDVVTCVYDVDRHSADLMVEMLSIHALASVGGALRSSKLVSSPKAARQRILDAAGRMFHRYGIRATGIDAVIAQAGVAKATFYRHFPAKDDLVVAWLDDSQTRWVEGVRRQAEERASSPLEAIPLVFDCAAEWFAAEGSRGCPYLNAAVEITDQSHPALRIVRGYIAAVDEHFVEMAAAAELSDPESLGPQLRVLLGGALIQSVAINSSDPFKTARDAALRLLESAPKD